MNGLSNTLERWSSNKVIGWVVREEAIKCPNVKFDLVKMKQLDERGSELELCLYEASPHLIKVQLPYSVRTYKLHNIESRVLKCQEMRLCCCRIQPQDLDDRTTTS